MVVVNAGLMVVSCCLLCMLATVCLVLRVPSNAVTFGLVCYDDLVFRVDFLE